MYDSIEYLDQLHKERAAMEHTHVYRMIARNPAALTLTGRCIDCRLVTVFNCADTDEMTDIEADWKRVLKGAVCASY